MDKNVLAFSIFCVVGVILAGCTASPLLGGGKTTPLPISVVPTPPNDNQTCTTDTDCLPAQ